MCSVSSLSLSDETLRSRLAQEVLDLCRMSKLVLHAGVMPYQFLSEGELVTCAVPGNPSIELAPSTKVAAHLLFLDSSEGCTFSARFSEYSINTFILSGVL